MQKISLRKQMGVVRLYLEGLSYDEIVARTGVSKGTVANIIADLRAGRIVDAQGPVEQLELLRELAIDLRRLKLTPGQAVAGLATISHLQELGVEPTDIQPWAVLCRELTAEGAEVQAFLRAALVLEEVRERTGLGLDALDDKARGLEEEVARLEPLAQELRGCKQQLEDLDKRRQFLADEVSQFEKRREPLNKDIGQKEQREAELSRRVQDLEHRAAAADERLAVTRRELQALAELGFSLDNLTGFGQRLAAVAQRHGIQSKDLRDRLLHELEELEAGLGLESCLRMKRDELNNVEKGIVKARREREALDSVLQQLRQQQATLHSSITEEQGQVRKEIQTIAKVVRDAAAELTENLGSGVAEALLDVEKLRDRAFELGQELGCYNAIIEANQGLQTLVALLKGDDGIGAGDVRVIALAVLRGLKDWIQQNQSQIPRLYWLTTQVSSAIQELEQWKI